MLHVTPKLRERYVKRVVSTLCEWRRDVTTINSLLCGKISGLCESKERGEV